MENDPNVLSNRPPGSLSTSLLERVKSREQKAWEQMVAICSPLVLRWCHQNGLQPADAEDLAQDVFRNVFRGIESFRRGTPGESFRAWLRTITINRIRDFRRAKNPPAIGGSTQAYLQDVADPDCPLTRVDEAEEQGILVRRVLRFLQSEYDERTWQAFWLVTIQEESVEHVAAQMQMIPNTIYVLRARILRRLRECLADLGETGLD